MTCWGLRVIKVGADSTFSYLLLLHLRILNPNPFDKLLEGSWDLRAGCIWYLCSFLSFFVVSGVGGIRFFWFCPASTLLLETSLSCLHTLVPKAPKSIGFKPHTYAHTYTHVLLYTCKLIYMQTDTFICTRMCARLCTHAHIHTNRCMYSSACMHMHSYMCLRMHTHRYTYTHAHAHTCINSHSHTERQMHIHRHTCPHTRAHTWTPLSLLKQHYSGSDREHSVTHPVADFLGFRRFWKVWKDIVDDK